MFLATDFQALQRSIHELDSHLTLRSFVVGHDLSIADTAVWAVIRGNKRTYTWIRKTPYLTNLHRWWRYIEQTNPWLSEIVAEISDLESKTRASASAAGASYEIDLPGVELPIVTRFPPEPSG